MLSVPVAVAAENAQVIFEQFCAVYPTLYVSGTVLAQELRDVTQKRDPSWLADWIAAPEETISDKEPKSLKKHNWI